MQTGKATTRLNPTDLAFRAFWLILVGVHVAPLMSVIGLCRDGLTAALAGKILGILLSMGFFAAKAAGLRVLRVRCRWSAAIAFLVICSFAHQDLRDELCAEPAAVIQIAAVVAAAQINRRLIRPEHFGGAWRLIASLLRADTWQRVVAAGLTPPALVFERASTVPRGPPAA